ncbi:DUF4198 domain-containing protein [Jannaschia sp.]|nr:DUF4198 domain-containing protein [Jannaschia sp.]
MTRLATIAAFTLLSAVPAAAHYGMILERPEAFTVTHEGETTDLLGDLSEASVMDAPGCTPTQPLDRPGTYVFAMTPAPQLEPAEDAFVQHFTKTDVSAYGDDEGWDTELGLRTEIVPLSKPLGLWDGNVFQGIVLLEGEPGPMPRSRSSSTTRGSRSPHPPS